jgi:hypothetical protein
MRRQLASSGAKRRKISTEDIVFSGSYMRQNADRSFAPGAEIGAEKR